MTEEKIQINNVSNSGGLQTFDFSGGMICNVETGICGPADEVNEKVEEENKIENNNMV